MAQFSWVCWLRSLSQSVRKPFRKWHARLNLEPLESRVTPTNYTWTGNAGAARPQWSNPANWGPANAVTGQPDGNPAGNAGQVEDLIFPSGVALTNTRNHLT